MINYWYFSEHFDVGQAWEGPEGREHAGADGAERPDHGAAWWERTYRYPGAGQRTNADKNNSQGLLNLQIY